MTSRNELAHHLDETMPACQSHGVGGDLVGANARCVIIDMRRRGMSSSAPVRAMKASTLRLTVSGDPMAEHCSTCSSCARSMSLRLLLKGRIRRLQFARLAATQARERLHQRRRQKTALFISWRSEDS